MTTYNDTIMIKDFVKENRENPESLDPRLYQVVKWYICVFYGLNFSILPRAWQNVVEPVKIIDNRQLWIRRVR